MCSVWLTCMHNGGCAQRTNLCMLAGHTSHCCGITCLLLPCWRAAGDLNETVVVGEVDEASKQLIKVTHDVSAASMAPAGRRCTAARAGRGMPAAGIRLLPVLVTTRLPTSLPARLPACRLPACQLALPAISRW